MADTLYVGRQPILNGDRDIAGYELLHRRGLVNEASLRDPDRASAEVIATAVLELGLERLVGSQPAYLNVGPGFFTSGLGLPATAEQVVIQVSPACVSQPATLEALRALAGEGYSLALNGFRYHPDLDPLLELVGAVKVDASGRDESGLREDVSVARDRGLTVIAGRVETNAQYELCRRLGCTLFQGYFFCRPQVLSGEPLPSNRTVLLTLMARLEDPAAEVSELERLIIQDVALCYRLLRHVNGASFALRRQVDTVRQAIILLGARLVRHWASLILMTRLAADTPGFQALMDVGLVRAGMCQRLAEDDPDCPPGQAFTVGLFSVLDAMLNQPMETLLDTVGFSPAIQLALADHSGPLGSLLASVRQYEAGEWEALGLDQATAIRYRDAFLEAAAWAHETRQALVGEAAG